MFEFSESTKGIDAPRTVRIIRAPFSTQLECVLLNDAPLCHAVHWCGERTLPHTSTQPCLWCERESPIKIEVYFAIWIPEHDQVRILTLTDWAAQPILQYRERNPKLRGRTLKVWRASRTRNGKISAEVYPQHELAGVMPGPVDIAKHLASVWESNILAVTASSCAIPGGENLANLRR